MARSISGRALAAINNNENNNEVFLWLAEIDHPSLDAPIRIVNDNVDCVTGGHTYYAWAFAVSTLPDLDNQNDPTCNFVVDNVDQMMVTAFKTLPIDVPPTLKISLVLAATPSTVEIGPITLTIRDVTITRETVTCTLGLPEALAENVPAYVFNPTNSPALFVTRVS